MLQSIINTQSTDYRLETGCYRHGFRYIPNFVTTYRLHWTATFIAILISPTVLESSWGPLRSEMCSSTSLFYSSRFPLLPKSLHVGDTSRSGTIPRTASDSPVFGTNKCTTGYRVCRLEIDQDEGENSVSQVPKTSLTNKQTSPSLSLSLSLSASFELR
eukprot:sb/3472948/